MLMLEGKRFYFCGLTNVFLDFCLTKTCKFDMRVLKTQRHIRDRKYGDGMEKKLQELETDSLM